VDVLADVVSLARWRGDRDSHRIAFTYDRHPGVVTLTYGQLDHQARVVAAKLQSMCPEGARAILLYPPGPEFFAGFFGCLYAGVIAVPAPRPRWPPTPGDPTLRRFMSIAKETSPAVVLTTQAMRAEVGAMSSAVPGLSGVRWLATDGDDADADRWRPTCRAPIRSRFSNTPRGPPRSPRG
jgi:acyl-CoA synthetase (AMP-forming)/AMP-acid ligase II